MADVVLEHVRKVYPQGGHVAIADASFAIGDGERLVLVGPSGCGKSTLLRMIAGLEDITSGTLSIGGRVVNDLAPKDRDIAMVFQGYALYPHMTVAQNMAFALELQKLAKADIGKRVREAAAILELDALLDRKPGQLSGGQRQRVALARALVRQPRVFLLDEPLSNLDAKLRAGMRAEIARIHARTGTTMVYVTHDQVEAMTLGQRIVVLKDGQVQQIDTPMHLYDRPANLFVAGFLGSPAMNVLRGTLVRDGELALLRMSDGKVLPLAHAFPAERFDKDILVGIRPERLLPAESGEAAFDARIEAIEAIGNETFVHLRLGEEKLVSRMPPRELPGIGQSLPMAVHARHLHYFDPETELRLDIA